MAHNELSHLDLRCLTFSLVFQLYIQASFQALVPFEKKKKKKKKTEKKKPDDIGHLKFGTERGDDIANSVDQWSGKWCRP